MNGFLFFRLTEAGWRRDQESNRGHPPPSDVRFSTREVHRGGRLQQEFNSLDAQRESAEAFIKSQANEGWVCLPERYDDGGFTGGNLDRPALRRLLADVEAGRQVGRLRRGLQG